MSYVFSVNNYPTTGAIAMYQLISALMAAGWVKKMDSDGTTYSSTGTRVTSGASGANGLGNNNAWVRLQAPPVNGGTISNQTREFTFQRGTTDLVWRVKYSASALFTGGSPAATATPSSGDEVFMIGGGTDASPTFFSFFATNGVYHWHICAGGSVESYSFVAWSYPNGGNLINGITGIFLDAMFPGSYPSSDVDPAVVYCNAGSNTFNEVVAVTGFTFAGNSTNPAICRGWMGSTSAAGASTSSNSVSMGMNLAAAFGKGNHMSTNPWTNKIDLFAPMWGSSVTAGPKGIKGFSTLFKFGDIPKNDMVTCDTISPGSKDKINFKLLLFPWSGVLPII